MAVAWPLSGWLERAHSGPEAWLARAVVFTGGALLMLLLMSAMGRIFGRRRWNVFPDMVQALRRVAQGDYSARVELPQGRNLDGPLGPVVTTFNEMSQALKRMEELRQEFISNVSHEIQSPLTSIKGFAQALKDPQIPPEQAGRYLSIIEDESDRLSRLAESLLKLSALDVQVLNRQPLRLDRQLRSALVALEPQWRAKKLSVDIETDELTVNADELLLSQVWTNLFHNAVKFTPPNGRISVQVKQGGKLVVVEVCDSGMGLTPEQAKQVFDRFYKADDSRTSERGGSGLGLSIAKKVVELHGGTLEVSSPGLGLGTVFRVSLMDNSSEQDNNRNL